MYRYHGNLIFAHSYTLNALDVIFSTLGYHDTRQQRWQSRAIYNSPRKRTVNNGSTSRIINLDPTSEFNIILLTLLGVIRIFCSGSIDSPS